MNECIVCESTSARPLYKGIFQCHNCKHVFSDLGMSDSELFEIYNKKYFFGEEYNNYVADRKILEKNFNLRLRVLKTFIDHGRHRKLLEVGSAYGFFLALAAPLFETVQGIDITEDGVRYSQEQLSLNVVQGDLLKHEFGPIKFDVVCMWDTIEHLRNPHLYLAKLNKYLVRGALIALTTGDIESLVARIQKDNWRLIHPPTHVHYFSKNTLSMLLDRFGFDILYNRYCGFYRSFGMAAYRMFVLNKKWPKLYRLLNGSGLTHLDFYLNLYDIVYVIARKR